MTESTQGTLLLAGASQGIGAATARLFVTAGWNVALLARSRDKIAALAEDLGPKALALPCDVTDFAGLEAAVATCRSHFGGLDAVIANAGVIAPVATLDAVDPKAWTDATATNLNGVFHVIRAALPALVQQGSGTIICVSSGASRNPLEGWSHYCAAKAGVAMLTRCLDLEARDKGIHAYALDPGTVATEMQRTIRASGVNPVSRLAPSDHFPPEAPARALLWLCGPQAIRLAGTEVLLRDLVRDGSVDNAA
ncbi:3-oxoacyl-[acyl-carrier-protein] reductase FabG (plasmid) [Marinibacterium anthonyi]|nr:3-oxoacyl-[acyl-carrier-protein] reductase FabG [Marinibacterium anthonyi]